MPSTIADESSVAVETTKKKHHKSHKREKSELGKRSHDAVEDQDEEKPRKHKKHKKESNDDDDPTEQLLAEQLAADVASTSPKKKEKKSKKDKATPIVPEEIPVDAAPAMTDDNTALATAGDVDVDEKEKHKKSKRPRRKPRISEDAAPKAEAEDGEDGAIAEEESRRKKSKHIDEDSPVEDSAVGETHDVDLGNDADEVHKEHKAKKKEKKDKKKKKRDKELQETADLSEYPELMDIDTSPSKASAGVVFRPANAPFDPHFPFFKQSLSLYVPLYPVGFSKPITSVAEQHLDPMTGHYSPLLQGVVLAYRNPSLSDRAKVLKEPPTDETPAILQSIDEYAVGFGWLTAEVDLFKPSRGAWLEGEVILQSEAHVGLLCFSKFNASIEAKRLPAGWKWIDLYDQKGTIAKKTKLNGSDEGGEEEDEGQLEVDEEPSVDQDDQLAHQMVTSGYWVDESGQRIRGRVLFRVKSYDTMMAGDYGFISIEGTMLDEEDERKLGAQEREEKRRRHDKHGGLLRPETRRVPEFSMTRIGKEDEEETSQQRQVFSKSRANTPDE